MVRIGDHPILWHIMKYYREYGFQNFVIALGYQGDSIRDYFAGMAARRLPTINGEHTLCFPSRTGRWS